MSRFEEQNAEGFAAATVTLGEGDEAQHVSLVLDMQDTPELLSKGIGTRHYSKNSIQA